MSREYKNIIKLRKSPEGKVRVSNIVKEIVKDSTPLPKPLEYEDIDKEFKRWVDEDLSIDFEGELLPTYSLFSNQRFSEFMQSWDNVDEKKNLIMNFKTVTRENNPKTGTMLGNTKNIPGDHLILLKRIEAFDRANRRYFIDYKVKQPFTVDLSYTIGLVTNKYELINKFNQLVNEKFKAINCYLRPNGHYIPMKLNDISDESEYNIDNRTYYSQNYSILVMGYILPRDSFIVEEIPDVKFVGFDGDINKSTYAEISESDSYLDENTGFINTPITLRVHIDKCATNYKFTIDTNFKTKKIILNNIRSIKVTVNDKEVPLDENFCVKENDIIKFSKIIRYKSFEDAELTIEGFDYSNSVKLSDDIEIKEIIVK